MQLPVCFGQVVQYCLDGLSGEDALHKAFCLITAEREADGQAGRRGSSVYIVHTVHVTGESGAMREV